MKVLTIIIIIVVLFVIVYFITRYSSSETFSNSKEIENEEIENKEIENKQLKDILMHIFTAKWCPHCTKSMDDFNNMVNTYNDKVINDKHIKIKILDSEDDKEFIIKQKIRGFPTIKLKIDGKDLDYNGKRTFEELSKYLMNYVNN